jgi:hypothetical protein
VSIIDTGKDGGTASYASANTYCPLIFNGTVARDADDVNAACSILALEGEGAHVFAYLGVSLSERERLDGWRDGNVVCGCGWRNRRRSRR